MQHLEISNKAARTLGLHLGLGLIAAVGTAVMIAIAYQLLWNVFGVGTDATDKDAWNRSGMKLHTDHGTGIEYLSAPGGGITRRKPDPDAEKDADLQSWMQERRASQPQKRLRQIRCTFFAHLAGKAGIPELPTLE